MELGSIFKFIRIKKLMPLEEEELTELNQKKVRAEESLRAIESIPVGDEKRNSAISEYRVNFLLYASSIDKYASRNCDVSEFEKSRRELGERIGRLWKC